MRLFTGSVISAALIFTAAAANAQGAAPRDAGRPGYVGASDFNGPYGDLPPEGGDSAYGRGPAYGPDPAPGSVYGPRGPAVGPGPAYGPGPGYGPALLPPGEVYLVLRENGFRPLGPPHQRGAFYFIAVTDRHGEDGRLVIDARNGQIVRFLPTYRMGNYFYGGAPIPSPSAGRMPPVSEYGEVPRPPAPVPKMASRSPAVPIPKAAPPRPVEDVPLAEKPTPQPSQQSAAVQVKPLDTPQPPHAAPPPAAEVKPAVPQIQPTQPMPQVQGLE
jgi:hypothetical protein